ncbi:MAG: hypothetical protein E7472_04560, partial [Ruminococcaceae bacterium]|nr:hypothetical protein [Oscillospiraceae bacterium]
MRCILTRRKNMKKRILSLLLAVVMLCSLLPVSALAAVSTSAPGKLPDGVEYTANFYPQAGTVTDFSYIGTSVTITLTDIPENKTVAVAIRGTSSSGGMLINSSNISVNLSSGSGSGVMSLFAGNPSNKQEWTVTLIDADAAPSGPSIKFEADLSTAEVKYIKNAVADPLTVTAAHSEGADVSYQWYSNTANSTEGGDAIADATSASYTPSTLEYGTKYYYAVASADGVESVTSKIAAITVQEPFITFGTQPSGKEYTKGDTADALTVAATQSEGADVEYQWYSNSANNTTGGTAIEGEIGASYTPSAAAEGTTYYYAVATSLDKNGEKNLKLASGVAKITVKLPVVSFSGTTGGSALYLLNAENVAALEVSASQIPDRGSVVTYQWYYNTTNSTTGGTEIDGGTDASYIPPVDAAGTSYYYVVASAEDSTPATSKVYTITVREMGVEFTTDLSAAAIDKYVDESLTLSVAAKPTVPDAMADWESKLSYQWYSNTENSTAGGTAIEGATGASYTVPTATVGTTCYYVVATLDGSYTVTSSVATVNVSEKPALTVTDNVIDIEDLTVYYKKNIATATVVNIKIGGADVEKATQDNNTSVDIVLNGITAPDAEISVEFGHSGSRYTMSGHTATVKLADGKAQLVMTLKGAHNSITSWSDTKTYTLNFSLGAPPAVPPTRLQETDSAETYAGVALDINLGNYFSNASSYSLVEGEEKTPLDGSTYTFKTFTGGSHTLVFAASNPAGECPDTVTVTVEVTEIKSGAWLGIETSNGSVNYVQFKDAEGNEIDGLTASLEGNVIKVSVPRSYAADGKITAAFNLTQNGGLPFITTKNGASGTSSGKAVNNKFTEKTTSLSSGKAVFTFYLYNVTPSATNNPYTTYTINYAIQNEAPVRAENQPDNATAGITADQSYTLDLDGLFTDPDVGDTITGWKVSVNGGAAANAQVDGDNVYSFSTNDAGEYTLAFYGLDNYGAVSTEAYTVTLTVSNATTTYDVTVNVPDGVAPTFYYTANAQEGTELTAERSGNIYTVKVPTNVRVISWRYNGAGMSAAVSDGCEALTLIQPVFTVKAGESVDTGATVAVAHASNLVGQDGNYLLLSGGGYTIKATPSETYIAGWNVAELKNQTISETEIELELVSRDVVITYPHFAELFVGLSSSLQGVPSVEMTPSKTTGPDYASGTRTASYTLTNKKVYEYRVSVPESNVNCDEYVTYAGTFVKTDDFSLTITEDMLKSGDNGRATIDRNTSNNRGNNVGDLYLNVNEKGYKSLSVGDEFKLIATRTWWGANADWLNTATSSSDHPYVNYYIVEPDFHYSVVGLDGQPSTGVIEIDEHGNIKAVGAGTAIVLVTYDAMTMNHDPNTYRGAIEGYKTKANEFFGAIWPENTGVFVVSVGADASGITTGMTINNDKATGQKLVGKALDAELDVIYFIGEQGEYTFTPGTEGVSVSVANPSVSETAMSFNGFTAVSANEDGSFSVPLTEGRNIVRLEKDGKAEYQVITAKGVSVKVNGEPLENAVVTPGQNVKIEFDKLYAPVNRLAFYNSSAAVVYSKVSGWNGKLAGNWRNSMGEYGFASYAPKQVVEHFVNTSTDGSSYSNSQVTTSDLLTVPADYEGEYFTLSGGAFNIGGFAKYMLGAHRDRLGKTAEGGYQMSDNLLCYLGRLPDISIPVATPTSIAVTTQPAKTEYNIGDEFDPSGMVVTASYEGSETTRTVSGYTYDTAAFTEAGTKEVTISYSGLTTTVSVEVTDVILDKLEVTTQPAKTLYYIGDSFDPAGMVITAVYSDKSNREITDYTYAPATVAKDTAAVTVTYGGKTVDVPVSVSLVERLEITRQPTKTSYTAGERFDPSG